MPPMAAGGMQRGVYGRAESPYNLDYLTAAFASGSSNGSATATSSCFAAFGMAEETVSSGRSPASNNGLVAYTPSRGIISIRGNWPLYPTCDVVVPHTRTVADLLELLDVIVAQDDISASDFWRDQKFVKIPEVSNLRPESYLQLREQNALKGKRLGVPRMYIGFDEPHGKHVTTRQSVIDLWKQARGDLEALGATVIETDFPVVTNYEVETFPGQSVSVPGLPDGWNSLERGPMVAYGWDDFLRQNNDPNWPSLETINTHMIFPDQDPTHPQLKYSEPQNRIKYTTLADFTTRRFETGTIDSLQDFPGLSQALNALEDTRKRDFEDWLLQHNLDGVVFPANGDVGRADADVIDDSARHAWQNGVKYSNGNRALRHLGIPTVTVTMGLMHDTGMPVGLTFAGPAYEDERLLKFAYAYESKSRRRVAAPLAPQLDSDVIHMAPATKNRKRGSMRPVIRIETASRHEASTEGRISQELITVCINGKVEIPFGSTLASIRATIDGDVVLLKHVDETNNHSWVLEAEVSKPVSPRWDGRMMDVPLAIESVMVIILAETVEGCVSGKMVLV